MGVEQDRSKNDILETRWKLLDRFYSRERRKERTRLTVYYPIAKLRLTHAKNVKHGKRRL